MCVKAPPLDLEPEEKEPEPVPTQEEPKEPEETVKIPEHVEESVVVPDFVEKAELVIQNQCSLFVVFLCVGIFSVCRCSNFLCFLSLFSNFMKILLILCVIFQFILLETLNSNL